MIKLGKKIELNARIYLIRNFQFIGLISFTLYVYNELLEITILFYRTSELGVRELSLYIYHLILIKKLFLV
jgi:hypothetical protein